MDAAGGDQDRLRTAAKVALVVGGLGFLISRVFVIRWASSQSPLVLVAAWYGILFALTQVVFPLVLGDESGLWEPHHAVVGLGFVLVWFAIGIVAYFPASTYSILVSGANPAAIPPYLISTEDQLTYAFWSAAFPGLGAVGVNVIAGFLVGLVGAVLLALWLDGRLVDTDPEGASWKAGAVLVAIGFVIAVLPIPLPPEGGLWVLGVLTYAVTPIVLVFAGVLLMRPEDVEAAVEAFD